MRLLHFEDGTFQDGKVSLVEFSSNTIPRYGILSHTWGPDDEEVTLRDIVEGTGQHKRGYRKIRLCGQKASKELQFFWIDTCCLDKSNNVEVQETINSMFRLYQEAAVCYVYLSDVSKDGFIIEFPPWEGRKWSWEWSEWFMRGWTLQELLAPKSVEFFSVDGEYLGDRNSHVTRIVQSTRIHAQALLHERPLSCFSINDRLLWAEHRKTRRDEDAAYSLLGLLGVQMPIMYGEGREQALIRLQQHINESQESKGHFKATIKSISRLISDDSKRALGKRGKYELREMEEFMHLI